MMDGWEVEAGVRRILVATDRSATADHAVRWAGGLARAYQAELLVLQALPPVETKPDGGAAADPRREQIQAELQQLAEAVAGSLGRARLIVHSDPAQAIVETVERDGVDVVVVGNVGMSGRTRFLLGNIPNRVSHQAPCTVIIVNTARRTGSAPGTRPSDATAEPSEPELLARAWHIGRVLLRAGRQGLTAGGGREDETGQRAMASQLSQALEQLGPTFAKLGQILSTRPDLLPPIFIDELARLQERVTPLTEAEVVAAMEQELGVPWEDVFASIDPTPLAAGTIAQVHRATLESGERVVVKVQRPTAERDITQDLGLLERFGRLAARRPTFRRTVDIPAMIEHLSSSLRRELDFRREAANIARMREILSRFPRLAVPEVYSHYSTARLLVMQEVQGVPLRQAPAGPACREAARQLLESYFHQVLSAGFFHADPHPGNMKWWNDTIYLLDLGMVGELDAQIRERLLLLLLAFAQQDGGFLAEVVLMLADGQRDHPAASVDLAAFKADLQALIEKYRALSLKEMQLGPILQEVTEISVRHRVQVPAALTLAGKAFAQMQLAAAALEPSLDIFAVAESFMLRSTLRQASSSFDAKRLFYDIQKTRLRLTRVLEGVESLVGARPGPGVRIDFGGTIQVERAIDRAGRRLSVALGLAGAAIGGAMLVGATRRPPR